MTFVAYELAASDKLIITIPIVDNQHCIRGHTIIRPMTKGVRKYARPYSWLEYTEIQVPRILTVAHVPIIAMLPEPSKGAWVW